MAVRAAIALLLIVASAGGITAAETLDEHADVQNCDQTVTVQYGAQAGMGGATGAPHMVGPCGEEVRP